MHSSLLIAFVMSTLQHHKVRALNLTFPALPVIWTGEQHDPPQVWLGSIGGLISVGVVLAMIICRMVASPRLRHPKSTQVSAGLSSSPKTKDESPQPIPSITTALLKRKAEDTNLSQARRPVTAIATDFPHESWKLHRKSRAQTSGSPTKPNISSPQPAAAIATDFPHDGWRLHLTNRTQNSGLPAEPNTSGTPATVTDFPHGSPRGLSEGSGSHVSPVTKIATDFPHPSWGIHRRSRAQASGSPMEPNRSSLKPVAAIATDFPHEGPRGPFATDFPHEGPRGPFATDFPHEGPRGPFATEFPHESPRSPSKSSDSPVKPNISSRLGPAIVTDLTHAGLRLISPLTPIAADFTHGSLRW